MPVLERVGLKGWASSAEIIFIPNATHYSDTVRAQAGKRTAGLLITVITACQFRLVGSGDVGREWAARIACVLVTPRVCTKHGDGLQVFSLFTSG